MGFELLLRRLKLGKCPPVGALSFQTIDVLLNSDLKTTSENSQEIQLKFMSMDLFDKSAD